MRSLLLFVALASLAAGCTASSAPGPRCTSPAPLYGQFDPRAPDYIVMYRDGVSSSEETARLDAVYGFTPTYVWTAVAGFAANLDDDVRDMLRCESSVKLVEHDAVVHLD
jgi:hypothetical protein